MTCDAGPTSMQVRDLGQISYAEALSLQRELNEAVIAGDAPPTLLLLEHDPVITISRRKSAREHLLASPDRLAAMGIDVQETDRGGDITYHGPGQLVAYPILPLQRYNLNLSRYMRLLEQIVIDTLLRFNIAAHRVPGDTGVWVPTTPKPQAPPPPMEAKICALGVRIRKHVTMHGLALNVTANLDHFATIVPCGLVGRPVTSLHQLLADATPPMAEVKAALTQTFHHHLAEPIEPTAPK
ncbi:lipoyl(octanoyl) transferase LipB [Phycisphaerales bacterium AB-hyl4]|uniref:Octanoyltransferase n=1 Tax=Natronomicrosphaera hydrolytica TaxID=3242702 RepID=A0ABV4U8T7_9BACT